MIEVSVFFKAGLATQFKIKHISEIKESLDNWNLESLSEWIENDKVVIPENNYKVTKLITDQGKITNITFEEI